MKIPLLVIFSLASIGLYAQHAGIELNDESRIVPANSNSYHYEIKRNDSLNINLVISNQYARKSMLWKNIAGMLTFGASSKMKDKEHKEVNKNVSINVSLLAGIAGMNVFRTRMQPVAFVEARQYNSSGVLLHTDRLRVSKSRKSQVYSYNKYIEQDGFVILTVENISKKAILVRNIGPFSSRQVFDTNRTAFKVRPTGKKPIINTEAPPCDCLDGGWFSPVTITANTPNGEFAFKAYMFESNEGVGPMGTWQVAPAGGSYGDGPGSAGPAGAEPGPEEKKLARELNAIQANPCEARYILDHVLDSPLMAYDLSNVQYAVNQAMIKNNLEEANANGSAKENAYKHALLYAYMYCEIGE